MRALKALIALAASTALTACITPNSGSDGMYANPIGDAPVTSNPTAYTPALTCLADYASNNRIGAPRIAVGRILDYTGSVSEDGGRRITQGASLMAISAFAKSGARLVERFDTSVTELELRYANNRLIGQEGAGQDNVRRIFAGQMPGSDYTFVGGITELNYNIRSQGVDASAGTTNRHHTSGNIGGRMYVMNIALDFRLIDTRTLEVVDVISYQKQIIGREVRAGVFNFFGDTFVDIAAGDRAMEPVQLAVRAGVERAVVEVMSNIYRVSDSSACRDAMLAEGDPMGPGTTQATGAFATAQPREQAQAAATQRADANAWHVSRDANVTGLRGRSEETQVAAPAQTPAAPTNIAAPREQAALSQRPTN